MKIVENKINDDVILSNHKLNDKEIINAYSKLVKQIKKQLTICKRALELACEKYIDVDGISYVLIDNKDYFDKSDEQIQKETIDYFVSQAKKELEEQDVKN